MLHHQKQAFSSISLPLSSTLAGGPHASHWFKEGQGNPASVRKVLHMKLFHNTTQRSTIKRTLMWHLHASSLENISLSPKAFLLSNAKKLFCSLHFGIDVGFLGHHFGGPVDPYWVRHYIWDPHSESLSCSPGHFSNFQVEVFRVQKSYHFGREKHVVCWSHVVRLLRVSGANLGLSLGFFASKNHAISVVKKHSVVGPMLYKFTGFPAPTLGGLQLRNRFEPVVAFFGCRSSLPPSWIRLVSGFPGLHFGLCGFHIGSILGSRVQFCIHFGFQRHHCGPFISCILSFRKKLSCFSAHGSPSLQKLSLS